MTVRKTKPDSPKPSDPVPIPDYDRRFATIREKTQNIDPIAEWENIKTWLAEDPVSISDIRIKVKEHADIAQRATNLYLMAKSELAEFELKYKDRRQLWRLQAIGFWEDQKEKGLRKQITEDMLTDWMISEHSDLYMELERRHETLISVKDQLKSMSDRVIGKGLDLRKLLESETRRPLTPDWFNEDEKKKSSNR